MAEVFLWGTRIGAVYQESLSSVPVFNYDSEFLKSGMEIAPITMPLSDRIFSFPGLASGTFHGLPGLLSDSLPDKFGTKLIERYLAEKGRSIDSLTAIERLLYTGKRGMGALEYEPASEDRFSTDDNIDLTALVKLASEILTDRINLHISADDGAMEQILDVGTSAGGARAKAIIAWNPETGDIRSGQIEAGQGYEYWLLKFDGVSNNKDKGEKADGKAHTRIEYAYYLMAKYAQIDMSECRLYPEAGRYHFMTKRFDRKESGEKIHMQSLGALAHFDYNLPGAYSYEQTYSIMNRIGLGQKDTEKLFRRMVFNILAQNHDDHVKNISFLMDKKGVWRLSPAYDVTYASDAANRWLARHQMSMNGKLEKFTREDFLMCGKQMNLSKAKINRILDEVTQALDKWESCAENAFLSEKQMEYIKKRLPGYDWTEIK
ncbi:MAG: type II toxin-antitoxin system HipA family toxin [Clostridiales bacterium]|nr:type II toxin-antitoxin system HipA family toxin [Clostridiales bacterium]